LVFFELCVHFLRTNNKTAPGKIGRQHVLDDIIWRAFGAAGIRLSRRFLD